MSIIVAFILGALAGALITNVHWAILYSQHLRENRQRGKP